MSYLEVTFPDFGMPVLYEENLSLGLRSKYSYPSYLVRGYQNFAENINKHSLDEAAGRDLSCLENFSQKAFEMNEEATYDALHKHLKLLMTQNKQDHN